MNYIRYLIYWIGIAIVTFILINYYYISFFSSIDITGNEILPEGGWYIGIIGVVVVSIAFGLVLLSLREKGLNEPKFQ